MKNNEGISGSKLALTPLEASRLLGISRNLTYKLISDGTIPSIKMGEKRIVIPVAALEKMLNSIDE